MFFSELDKEDNIKLSGLIQFLVDHPGSLISQQKIHNLLHINQQKLNQFFKLIINHDIGSCLYPMPVSYCNIEQTSCFKFYFNHSHYLKDQEHYRADQQGALLEQDFFINITKLNAEKYFFRSKDGIEVDFVLINSAKKYMDLIEIKKDQFIYSADLQGLHFLDKNCPMSKDLKLFHAGTRHNFEGKVEIMPLDKGEKYLLEKYV